MSVFKYKPLISVYFNEIEIRLKYKINEYDYKQLRNFTESDYQRFVDFFKLEMINVDFENKRSNINRGIMKKYNPFMVEDVLMKTSILKLRRAILTLN